MIWAPSLVFAHFIKLLLLWLQRIQSVLFWCWLSGDVHFRVFFCAAGRGCLLWPVWSLGKTLLAFALLHSKAKFARYSRCFLTSYICIFYFQTKFTTLWIISNIYRKLCSILKQNAEICCLWTFLPIGWKIFIVIIIKKYVH